ncbi:MAG: lysophospholipid acyltransferase family protein [Candidatus Bipolaricaulota bacterium]
MSRLRSELKTGFYTVSSLLSFLLLKVLFRLRIEGRASVPHDQGFIVVARHRSYWDILMMIAAFGPRHQLHFVARKGLLRGLPFLQPLIRTYSTVIDREDFGVGDYRKMIAAARDHRLVCVFPEGTTRRRGDAKAGARYLATSADKRILPVNIHAEGPYPPKYPFRFPRTRVSIGSPVRVEELDTQDGDTARRSERYREMSERLMERVDRA